jgi:hypothetical protein
MPGPPAGRGNRIGVVVGNVVMIYFLKSTDCFRQTRAISRSFDSTFVNTIMRRPAEIARRIARSDKKGPLITLAQLAAFAAKKLRHISGRRVGNLLLLDQLTSLVQCLVQL